MIHFQYAQVQGPLSFVRLPELTQAKWCWVWNDYWTGPRPYKLHWKTVIGPYREARDTLLRRALIHGEAHEMKREAGLSEAWILVLTHQSLETQAEDAIALVLSAEEFDVEAIEGPPGRPWHERIDDDEFRCT